MEQLQFQKGKRARLKSSENEQASAKLLNLICG